MNEVQGKFIIEGTMTFHVNAKVKAENRFFLFIDIVQTFIQVMVNFLMTTPVQTCEKEQLESRHSLYCILMSFSRFFFGFFRLLFLV